MRKILTITCFVLTLCICLFGSRTAYAAGAPSESSVQEQADETDSSGGVFGSSVALIAVGGGGAIAVNGNKRKKAGGKKTTAALNAEPKRNVSRASTTIKATDREDRLAERGNT